jgi:hypothetical protein
VSVRARTLRRRARPTVAARIRTFWVIGLLVLIGLAAIAIVAVNAPQFRVRSVEANVPNGSPVAAGTVIDAARIDPDANIWLLNTAAIRRRIEAIPDVDTARVIRAQWPAPAVSLAISLRVPTGCVRAAGGLVTIDRTSRVLQTGCVAAALPLVDAGNAAASGPGTTLSDPDIQRLLADARAIGDQVPVRLVRRDRYGGLEAVDTRGVVVKFGADDDLAGKIALVEPVRRAAGARPLRAIDLRAPATPVVEFP